MNHLQQLQRAQARHDAEEDPCYWEQPPKPECEHELETYTGYGLDGRPELMKRCRHCWEEIEFILNATKEKP